MVLLVDPHPSPHCWVGRVTSVLPSPQDRDNSPSSCAGLFIASHIGFDWPGVWVHLDIAAPVHAVSAGPRGRPPRPGRTLPWLALQPAAPPVPPLGLAPAIRCASRALSGSRAAG